MKNDMFYRLIDIDVSFQVTLRSRRNYLTKVTAYKNRSLLRWVPFYGMYFPVLKTSDVTLMKNDQGKQKPQIGYWILKVNSTHPPPQTTVLSSNTSGVASEYRGPSPSAPVLEEVGVEKYPDQTYFQPKQESYPMQASS